MKDKIYLYHALKNLATPLPDGQAKEFSFLFVVASGKRKGQKLFVKRAVVNHFSYQKTMERLKQPTTTNRGKYNRIEERLLTVRVLESDDVKDKIISPKILSIIRINDLKVYI